MQPVDEKWDFSEEGGLSDQQSGRLICVQAPTTMPHQMMYILLQPGRSDKIPIAALTRAGQEESPRRGLGLSEFRTFLLPVRRCPMLAMPAVLVRKDFVLQRLRRWCGGVPCLKAQGKREAQSCRR